MQGRYDPKTIEGKWQAKWEEQGVFSAHDDSEKPKYYCLIEFPYPSGQGLHIGHIRSNTAMDIVARKRRMEGFDVLYPIGWDAFGLPTENYAIKTGIHPREVTRQNTDNFRRQLKGIGFSFDWSREINTTDPAYFKWTQWIFLQMLKKGLAYKAKMMINWCPSCKIGLANEEVVDGKCERCGNETEKREKEQWMLAITKYADRLHDDLDTVDYLEKIKIQQRNWIGRSEGTIIEFGIKNKESGIRQGSIEVFTTRVDTLFGCSYVVVAPEHPLVKNQESGIRNWEEVVAYLKETKKKTEMDRTAEGREKTGVRLDGLMAINPINGEVVPVFVADYVLGDYGTGAVMAVPAHDERDYAFAKKYDLPVKYVIHPTSFSYKKSGAGSQAIFQTKEDIFPEKDAETERWLSERLMAKGKPYTSEGKLINSNTFTGIHSTDAREKISEKLEADGNGKKVVKYKLRDWVFSRQRYWGEPIPVVHCEQCGIVALPESELPLELPEIDGGYSPTDTGESPLAKMGSWVNTTCPTCGGPAKRETDTMPNWAGSSWYFLRYIDPKNGSALADPEKLKRYMPVDWYNGGMEHTTLHLLYSRFWNKFLFDIGVAPTSEPYQKRTSHGLILAEGGVKMSKSKGNVINPDDIVSDFGADTLRIYEMFMGPFDQP
ncbi:MAG: leucine--tRNA ligase, partial [Candidatus Moranbacteria bacterium]|nr:leucine--tRNA ligase [Candidatus Moranbacteria bacterium]